jgi:hypothetical protein
VFVSVRGWRHSRHTASNKKWQTINGNDQPLKWRETIQVPTVVAQRSIRLLFVLLFLSRKSCYHHSWQWCFFNATINLKILGSAFFVVYLIIVSFLAQFSLAGTPVVIFAGMQSCSAILRSF